MGLHPITFIRTTANAAGWNNTDVAVDFSATDALSGVVTEPVDVTLAAEAAGQWASATATDAAGNVGSLSVTGINIDKTAPTIAVSSPSDGASYLLSANVTPDYSYIDGLSGIVSHTAPATVDTSTVGPHSFTVTAKDAAGNIGSATSAYDVDYRATAFLDPLRLGRAFKQGSTIPIKWP